MKYAFLLYEDEDRFHGLDEADQIDVITAHKEFIMALAEANAMIAGDALEQTDGAKHVRGDREKSIVQDGPFTDTKEQLGGFYLIEAANLDEALDWAAQCPSSQTGYVEVRPVWAMGD